MLVLDRTPFAVAVAVLAVLFTPAIPLRTLLLPLAVLFVAVLAKIFGMPRLSLTWPSTIVLAFVMLFFSWSGVVARAFPYFLQRANAEVQREVVAQALPANGELTLDVPDGATSLIVSGANVARMTRGTPHRQDRNKWGRVCASAMPRTGCAAEGVLLRHAQSAAARSGGTFARYTAIRLDRRRGPGAVARKGADHWSLAHAALPPGASIQVEGFE